MDSQVEKTIVADPQSTPTSTTTDTLGTFAPNPENEHELPKQINGGLNAWLGVLAGFCIFVNSW